MTGGGLSDWHRAGTLFGIFTFRLAIKDFVCPALHIFLLPYISLLQCRYRKQIPNCKTLRGLCNILPTDNNGNIYTVPYLLAVLPTLLAPITLLRDDNWSRTFNTALKYWWKYKEELERRKRKCTLKHNHKKHITQWKWMQPLYGLAECQVVCNHLDQWSTCYANTPIVTSWLPLVVAVMKVLIVVLLDFADSIVEKFPTSMTLM